MLFALANRKPSIKAKLGNKGHFSVQKEIKFLRTTELEE